MNNNINDSTNFSKPIYEDSEFKNIAVCNELITNKQFIGCTFANCTFNETVFQNCVFEDCKFQTCDLSLVKLPNTLLNSVEFIDSKMVGTDFSKTKTFQLHMSFLECIIDNANFSELNLSGINIIKCRAKDADFTNANFTKAKLDFTDFSASRFSNTNLTETDFSLSTNYDIDPADNFLKKTIFSLPDAVSLLQNLDIIIK